MKRITFLVAAMAATSAAPAFAQSVPDPGRMFLINAVTPGVVSFSGEGTAQFNNSASTSNAFSVGSSSNFGVNASVSSTNDYLVDANALFKLADSSQLQQTIGTSSSAANTQAASEASAKAASSIADTKTTSEFGQNWQDFQSRQGLTPVSGTGALTTGIENPNGGTAIKTEAAYNAAKQDYKQQQIQEAFSAITNAATSSSSSGASGQGIIEGNFLTTNTSSSKIGATAASSAGSLATAQQEADKAFGTTYSDYQAQFTSYAGADGKITTPGEIAAARAAGVVFNTNAGTADFGKILNENKGTNDTTSWSTEKNAKRDSVFNELQNAAASQGTAESKSEAVVQVKGVGSIATLNASGDSAFNVDVATRLRNSIPETNGTANGSAGGNLATSSFANQSNTQSASAFMQAFGADTVSLNKNSDGSLNSITANGRFNVTVDADPSSRYLGASAGSTSTLDPLKVLVP